jgi:hypothetical protein
MSNGFNVANINFDAYGNIIGLSDDVLALISAGAMDLGASSSATSSVVAGNTFSCNHTCNPGGSKPY